MRLAQIEVVRYGGAAADESPCRFNLEGQIIEVDEVLDRWYQIESKPEWPRADYFKVRAVNEHEYLLKRDLESDEWFVVQQCTYFCPLAEHSATV